MNEMSKQFFLQRFKVLNELKEDFKQNIKLLHVFKDLFKEKLNVFLVTNDDKVYCLGSNRNGLLDFGNDRDEVNELT